MGDRLGVFSASGFLISAQQICKVIKESKDLDIPAYKVILQNKMFFPSISECDFIPVTCGTE